MRIVVDLQSCQTGSRYRGIGRYSMALFKAMLENPRGHEFVVVLNSAGGEWIEMIRGELDHLLEQDQIRVWQAPPSASPVIAEDAWRRTAAGVLRESFIRSLRPDVVHVSSVFEGVADEAIVTINKFFDGPPVAVTHYDLIPYLYPEKYLPTAAMRRVYDARIETLQRANRFLAISGYSGNELVETLGVDPSLISNISAGVDSQFRKLDISGRDKDRLFGRLGLTDGFIMYTGGGDSRKNIANLIRAYARLPAELISRHQLAVISKMSADEASELHDLVADAGLDQRVRFFDYLPDDDLVRLFNLCAVFVLPSFHEGFGLPLLEAMACGVPALGSNRTSIPEVLGREHAMFDPSNVDEIAARISAVLTDEAFSNRLREEGLVQAEKFSWARSAELTLDALEKLHEEHRGKPLVSAALPRPSRASSLAIVIDAADRMLSSDGWRAYLEELAGQFDVSVVFRNGTGSRALLSPSVRMISDDEFERRAMRFAYRLYRIGGDANSGWVADLAKRYPGHVSIDGFSLGNVYLNVGESQDRLLREMYVSHGYQPLIRFSEGASINELIEIYPCNRSLLQGAIATCFTEERDVAAAASWYGDELSGRVRYSQLFPDAASATSVSECVRNLAGFLGEHGRPPEQIEIADRLIGIEAGIEPSASDIIRIAECVIRNLPEVSRQRQIFVDMTELIASHGKSGIQRVVRAVATELLQRDLPGFRVEPVYSVEGGTYCHAREHVLHMFDLVGDIQLHDAPIEPRQGDIFLRLDLTLYGKDAELQRLRDRGVRIYELMYDLLPVKWPEHFVDGMPQAFHRWLDEASRYADGVICISKAVADEFADWLDGWQPERPRPLKIGYFHLGADIENSVPTRGISAQVETVLNDADTRTFLMVGTIESRKGYSQVLDAFDLLWAAGEPVRLVIVGREGWLVDSIVQRLREHSEYGRKLFWLSDISDEALLELYEHSHALIMASVAEGFGLPLIEAARHALPLIVRDLPVFHEVAGEGAFYFQGESGKSLAEAVNRWMQLLERDDIPRSGSIEMLDWKQSVDQLLAVVLEDSWYRTWSPGKRYLASPACKIVEVRGGRMLGQKVVSTSEAGLMMTSRPYRVTAGKYEMTLKFEGDMTGQPGSVWYDLAVGSGKGVLQTRRLSEMRQDERVGVYNDMVEFQHDYDDVQFRLWTGAGSDLVFHSVELLPLQGGEPEAVVHPASASTS